MCLPVVVGPPWRHWEGWWETQSYLPDIPPLVLSLSQVRDTNCRAFIHHAAQGDTDLLANLPNQRVGLQRTALACLVGT